MNHFLTDAMLEASIQRMDEDFDSHAVITDLMTHSSQDYVRDLYAHVDHSDPILAHHAVLGTRLGSRQSIERTQKVFSPNVRGQTTENQGWRKRRQP